MPIVIDLTPQEEERICVAARQNGLAPSEWVKKLVVANLPITAPMQLPPEHTEAQLQDGTFSLHAASTPALFAIWALEDALLTEEERQKNERIYAEIEKNGIPGVQI